MVTGATSAADFYILSARQNQTLTVRVSSPLNNARFEFICGDGIFAYRETEWSRKLEFRTDYYNVVLSNDGNSADYRLEVTVR